MNQFLFKAKQAAKDVADATQRQKLKGEILLAEREITNRKRMFGVDVYEVMTNAETKKNKLWSSGKGEGDLRPPFDDVKKQVTDISQLQASKQQQIDVLDIKMVNKIPAVSMSEKMKNGGNLVKEAAMKKKLQGEMLLCDRDIKNAKSAFGIIMYDLMNSTENDGGWKASDKDVKKCYDGAKNDIGQIYEKIEKKQRDIIALGGTRFDSTTSASMSNVTAGTSNQSPDISSA